MVAQGVGPGDSGIFIKETTVSMGGDVLVLENGRYGGNAQGVGLQSSSATTSLGQLKAIRSGGGVAVGQQASSISPQTASSASSLYGSGSSSGSDSDGPTSGQLGSDFLVGMGGNPTANTAGGASTLETERGSPLMAGPFGTSLFASAFHSANNGAAESSSTMRPTAATMFQQQQQQHNMSPGAQDRRYNSPAHRSKALSLDSGLFTFQQIENELSSLDGPNGYVDALPPHHHYHPQQQQQQQYLTQQQQQQHHLHPQEYRAVAGSGSSNGHTPSHIALPRAASGGSTTNSTSPSFAEAGGVMNGLNGINTPGPLHRRGYSAFSSLDSPQVFSDKKGGGLSNPGHLHSNGLSKSNQAAYYQPNGTTGMSTHQQFPSSLGMMSHLSAEVAAGGHRSSPSLEASRLAALPNGLQQQARYLQATAGNNVLDDALLLDPTLSHLQQQGGLPSTTINLANAAAVGGNGTGLPTRMYLPQGYEGPTILGTTTLPSHQNGGVSNGLPTHFVTAAGMVPINQLMSLQNGSTMVNVPIHLLRNMGAGSGGIPIDGLAYAATANGHVPVLIPTSSSSANHPSLNGGAVSYSSGGSSDSRDGSPSGFMKDDLDGLYSLYPGSRRSSRSIDRPGERERERERRSNSLDSQSGLKKRVERDPDIMAALASATPSLEEVLKSSSVHSLSQDQVGCRFLQLKLDESGAEAATMIFLQAKPYLAEMMTDPFGNYLFQKILDKSGDKQRSAILSIVKDDLVEGALNLHGTRSVQRILEVCKTPDQLEIITSALRHDVVRLCVDANGNHVIQRALQHLAPEDRAFVFEAVSQACLEVSTHRHGCCVVQRCLDAATPPQRRAMVVEIGRNCLQLMQDPYGNYVVQYVLDRCPGDEIRPVTSCPLGRIASLSVQKYSSNVIEKCLEKATEDLQSAYIDEMCAPGNIKHLMQDQYANYVVQRALSVATHSRGLQLVDAVRPHLHAMRNTAGGRRILTKITKRFPNLDLGTDMLSSINTPLR